MDHKVIEHKTMLCGGYTPSGRELTADEAEMIKGFKEQIESRNKEQYSLFIPETVKTQVVSGTNYDFTIKVDCERHKIGWKRINAVVYKPLPHTGSPAELTSCTK